MAAPTDEYSDLGQLRGVTRGHGVPLTVASPDWPPIRGRAGEVQIVHSLTVGGVECRFDDLSGGSVTDDDGFVFPAEEGERGRPSASNSSS